MKDYPRNGERNVNQFDSFQAYEKVQSSSFYVVTTRILIISSTLRMVGKKDSAVDPN